MDDPTPRAVIRPDEDAIDIVGHACTVPLTFDEARTIRDQLNAHLLSAAEVALTDDEWPARYWFGDETCEECETTGVNCELHRDNAAEQERRDLERRQVLNAAVAFGTYVPMERIRAASAAPTRPPHSADETEPVDERTPRPGDPPGTRCTDGGVPGTLVACDACSGTGRCVECSGRGTLHQADPEPVRPAAPPDPGDPDRWFRDDPNTPEETPS